VQLEWWLSDADSLELSALGRTDPDTDPMVLRGGVVQSIYLEPLLNRKKWEDLSTPKDSTLAHELLFGLRGQYAFGDRLIPQAEMVVGGLYTVRGYPEAIVAGDDAVIGSIEYRLHVPRIFDLEHEPPQFFGRTFRRAPQYVFGPVDWDLIPKVFFDVGKVYVNDPQPFESDYSLMSVGIGIDIIYRRNLNVRIDWGFVLDDIPALNVNDGSNRLHFVATILF
jgi:hemolysin activation/secretion protein